ncbi:MAG: protein kinase, partial [Cyanobacteria bacterium J06627_15]
DDATPLASSVDHLHSNGIMHGDLYAHNILINASGESILGDFGAASLYDVETRSTSQSLEQIEARAFGCLLEDLLERCTDVASPNDKTTTEQLRYLQRDCMQPMPSNRPLFASMCERLSCL